MGLEITGLFTAANEAFSRVAVHGVRRAVLRAQAEAVGLPVTEVDLPYPCSNEIYEARTGAPLGRRADEGLRDIVFGDLFLRDIRAYRERQLAPFGITPHFALCDRPTDALAREMIEGGTEAVLATPDPRKAAEGARGPGVRRRAACGPAGGDRPLCRERRIPHSGLGRAGVPASCTSAAGRDGGA